MAAESSLSVNLSAAEARRQATDAVSEARDPEHAAGPPRRRAKAARGAPEPRPAATAGGARNPPEPSRASARAPARSPGRPGRAPDRPGPDYLGIFDASPNPYLVLDRDLCIVAANRAYLASTKRRLEDIVGRWAWDAFPTDPETLRQSVASFERVLREGKPDTMALLRFDIPRPEAEGGGFEERYWSIVHAPVPDAAGEVALVVQHPIDVTELKRLRDAAGDRDGERRLPLAPDQSGIFSRARTVHEANRSLQAEGDRLRRLFEQTPGFACVLRGPEHRFEMANAAYLRLVGRGDLLGKPVREALPELQGQGFFELLDRVYATGEPFVGHGAEVTLRAASGALRDTRYVDFVYQPITDEAGRVSGIFVQGGDVTAAKRAAEELRAERDRSRGVLESMAEGFALLDRDWRIVEINAEGARLDGRPREALLGRTHWEVWPTSVGTAVEFAYRRAMAERIPVALEHRYVGEGRDAWLELRAYPSGDGLAIFYRNITARKRGEERLREVEARQAFLLRLGDALRPLRGAAEIQVEASRLLGEHLRAARVGFGAVDARGAEVAVHRDWSDGRLPPAAGTLRMDDFGPAVADATRRGETVAVSDAAHDPRTRDPAVAAAYARIGARAVLNVPFVKAGRLAAMLFVHHPEPRAWTTAEVQTVEEACERLWGTVERARTEAALRESETRFRLMADAVPQIVWITDAEGRTEFFNRQWSDYTGADFEPSTAAAVAEGFVHPDDRAHTAERFEEARRAGGTFFVEHRIRSKSGDHRWFLVRGEPYRDPQTGEVARWFGASVDIHDRKLAEERLREREERLRLIVENARDYAILTTDPEGRIDAWLPGAASVFGWSAEEAAGRDAAMIFTPEDRERGEPEKELGTARAEGVAPNVRWHSRKDGSRVFIEGSVTALRGPDGGVRGFLKIGQDVTERKAAEERQALLAREVDHRAKNALAVVQSVLRLTRADSVEAYAKAAEGRVTALARAQTLLAEDRWSGADLRALLEGELVPFLGDRRAELDGPRVALPPGAAQPLAMAFHELATNAVKHGALSVRAGRISVRWRLGRGPDGAPVLRLRWAEAGGPPIADAPSRRGFGSRVLDGTVRGQLGGAIALAWEASGLVCEMEVPLEPRPECAAAAPSIA